jgi:hypothetical protein
LVVCGAPEEQMRWIATTRVVATMADENIGRKELTRDECKHYPMRVHGVIVAHIQERITLR